MKLFSIKIDWEKIAELQRITLFQAWMTLTILCYILSSLSRIYQNMYKNFILFTFFLLKKK